MKKQNRQNRQQRQEQNDIKNLILGNKVITWKNKIDNKDKNKMI